MKVQCIKTVWFDEDDDIVFEAGKSYDVEVEYDGVIGRAVGECGCQWELWDYRDEKTEAAAERWYNRHFKEL
jgi:hypothetical protein